MGITVSIENLKENEMAITGVQLQAALGSTENDAKVTQEFGVTVTEQNWYVVGNLDAPGRDRLVTTTASDDAATQAAAVITALTAT